MSTLSFDAKLLNSAVDKNGVLVMKYTDKDAYVNGTELTEKQIKEVQAYNSEYCKAVAEFAKTQALEALKKDSKLQTVKVEMPWSTNSYGKATVTVNRKKTYPSMNGSPEVTKSTLQMKLKDPAVPGKTFISGLEDELTKALLK